MIILEKRLFNDDFTVLIRSNWDHLFLLSQWCCFCWCLLSQFSKCKNAKRLIGLDNDKIICIMQICPLCTELASISSTLNVRILRSKAFFLVKFWLWTNFCSKNTCVKHWWNWHLESISSTFYSIIFCTKVLCAAFSSYILAM